MRYLMAIAVLLAAGCSSRQVVVVYSPHGKEMLGDYEKLYEAAHPEGDSPSSGDGFREGLFGTAAAVDKHFMRISGMRKISEAPSSGGEDRCN